MTSAEIRVSVKLDNRDKVIQFLQAMSNRMIVGQYRHGGKLDFNPAQDYYSKIKERLDRYQETGNLEFLIDAANFCMLEFYCSLHPNAHFKAEDSGR